MWFRKRKDSDFQAEVESHIRMEADRLTEEEGMSPSDAEASARRTFGNLGSVNERFYESQRVLWLEHFIQDLRYGLRSLRRAPVFTATVMLTIALGVGANTAVFSLIDAVMLRTLPVQDPGKLVFLQVVGSEGGSGGPPYPCFTRLRDETKSFAGMATFSGDELRIEVDGKPESVMGQVSSGNYFEVLGVKPALGRLMNANDEKLDPPVAVISYSYWHKRFGGNPDVLGRTISFRGRAFQIIGVTPSEFWGMKPGSRTEVTIPITVEPQSLASASDWWLQAIVARLRSGADMAQANAEIKVIFSSFMADSKLPKDMVAKHFRKMEVAPASLGMSDLRRRFSTPLYVLMGIVGLVLVMATLNIANLLVVRSLARQREFAIRLATGAGRFRLMRQVLTETLLLFVAGAIPGILLANIGVDVIQGLFAQGRRAITLEAALNWRVLLFTLAVTLAAALLALPAWRAFRADPGDAINEGQSRNSESRGALLVTRTLVALQVALSLVLLAGAITFVRTLANLREVNTGFQNENVLTMSLDLPGRYMNQAGKASAVWSDTLEELRKIPGLKSAALGTYTPLSGRDRGSMVQVRGYQPASSFDRIMHINQVSDGYFETLGIDLISGRSFTDRDSANAPKVAVINESAVKKFFAGRDPIGQSIEFLRNNAVDASYQVVGVVRDSKHMNLREPVPPFVFLPFRQGRNEDRRVTLIVAAADLQTIRMTIARVDPAILISEVISIRNQVDSTLLTERMLSGLSTGFGALALLLASIGLYGVLSYRIGQQRQAIGIRMALGATPRSIAWNVFAQSSVVIAAGLILGLPFAFLAARAADSILWGVQSSDPAIYVAGIAVLCAVGAISAYIPARRASAIDPAEALRQG
jgi:predicted permease